MTPDIRPMRMEDLPHVLQNERRSYTHPWREGIFQDCLTRGHECWLMIHGGRIVGHGIVSVAAGESHLLNVCVHPECQGNGFGRAMVEHLLRRAKERQAGSMFLEVRSSNLLACQLYEKLGFNEIGRREDYYPACVGREDAIVLAKELSQP